MKNSIESKIKAATAPLEKQIQELKGQLKAAYTYITDIVKASGMLAYDDGVYKVSLTAVQKISLVSGIPWAAISWAIFSNSANMV